MIDVKGLVKRYGNFTAVDDINFSVPKGTILGFLGPNGAGKTTTMRMLTCFLPPTEGKIKVVGYDTFKNPLAVRKQIGYLPENVPLYNELRIQEFLKFRAKLKGVPANKRKKDIEKVMSQCGIINERRKIIGHLSKGFRQRVGLADALIGNPPILILDEPTIGLDPYQVTQVRKLIHQLGEEHTIILSTHILSEVEMICSDVVIINKGQIIIQDTLENLVNPQDKPRIVSLVTKGPGQNIKNLVEGISGVRRITWQQGGDTDAFRIETDSNVDIRENLFHTIARNNWTILEMTTENLTLEDVFIDAVLKEEGKVQ